MPIFRLVKLPLPSPVKVSVSAAAELAQYWMSRSTRLAELWLRSSVARHVSLSLRSLRQPMDCRVSLSTTFSLASIRPCSISGPRAIVPEVTLPLDTVAFVMVLATLPRSNWTWAVVLVVLILAWKKSSSLFHVSLGRNSRTPARLLRSSLFCVDEALMPLPKPFRVTPVSCVPSVVVASYVRSPQPLSPCEEDVTDLWT